jgi:MoaA/NifB/PqqE/SkfB family radical SAM enzyme
LKASINIERLLAIVTANSFQDLEQNQETIAEELRRIGVQPKYQQNLIQKIIKIAHISNNPKVRECYLRSYFRAYQEGIDTDGRDSPIIIEITKRCNKHCLHCYSRVTGQRQEMTDAVLNHIMKYARTQAKHVFLTGGEPTLDPRVFLLAEKNPDIMFFLFTNGSTMTEEYAQRLASYGNVIPLIGIDGASPATHDRLRGEGSYQEVMNAIDLLQKANASWGYISLVTEQNAHEVLSDEFIVDKTKKGAFIARYLEYLPVGLNPLNDLILSGETYYFLEKRKKEIIQSGIIYMQETTQKKCHGLLFFDVDGNIKNCFCFHYTKYNVAQGNIKKSVEKIRNEWTSYNWMGECHMYSDPIGFKNHLEKIGWKKISSLTETYLSNPDVAKQLMNNYKRFLTIKTLDGF